VSAPALARAGEETVTFTYGPVRIPGHGVAQGQVAVASPKVDGYVVGMEAEVVDAAGRVQGPNEVMLHHVVFVRTGEQDITCLTPFERFWAKRASRRSRRRPFRRATATRTAVPIAGSSSTC
jgi:hypothetical protein